MADFIIASDSKVIEKKYRLQIPVVELCFSLFLLAYTTGPVSIMKIYCAFHSEVDVPH